jgi:hypothetical protein
VEKVEYVIDEKATKPCPETLLPVLKVELESLSSLKKRLLAVEIRGVLPSQLS